MHNAERARSANFAFKIAAFSALKIGKIGAATAINCLQTGLRACRNAAHSKRMRKSNCMTCATPNARDFQNFRQKIVAFSAPKFSKIDAANAEIRFQNVFAHF